MTEKPMNDESRALIKATLGRSEDELLEIIRAVAADPVGKFIFRALCQFVVLLDVEEFDGVFHYAISGHTAGCPYLGYASRPARHFITSGYTAVVVNDHTHQRSSVFGVDPRNYLVPARVAQKPPTTLRVQFDPDVLSHDHFGDAKRDQPVYENPVVEPPANDNADSVTAKTERPAPVIVQSFDNVEQLFDALKKGAETADAAVKDWQRKLKVGDFFRQVEGDLTIFGEVVDSPYEEDRARMAEQPNRRMVKAYSMSCPEGELGTIHVSRVQSILTERGFEDAKAKGWAK